jgi:N-acyl-D-aspartate/D-glutamate deacylase
VTEGPPWNWQSFPISSMRWRRAYDMTSPRSAARRVARVVMGERGADREPATEQDRAEMARLAADQAGALGFGPRVR